MFEVELEKRFPARQGGFSLKVSFRASRKRLVIFGPSGSGKSLTLKAMAGFLRPDSGRVVLNGRVLFDSGAGLDIPARRRGIGYVFQDYALFPHLTVRQNVGFGLAGFWPSGASRKARAKVEDLLERFGIAHVAGNPPSRISGGQRQRTALARALAREPAALFLDEPLSALDPLLRRDMRAELLDALDRLTIPSVMISHDPEDVEAFADTLAVVDRGQVRRTVDYQNERRSHASPFEMLTGLLS